MKVIISGQIFNSEDKPIRLVLSNKEKNMIKNMEQNEFVVYPSAEYWTYKKT